MNTENQSVFNENDFLKFLKCKLDVKREGIWKIKYFFLHFAIVSFIRLAVFGGLKCDELLNLNKNTIDCDLAAHYIDKSQNHFIKVHQYFYLMDFYNIHIIQYFIFIFTTTAI